MPNKGLTSQVSPGVKKKCLFITHYVPLHWSQQIMPCNLVQNLHSQGRVHTIPKEVVESLAVS